MRKIYGNASSDSSEYSVTRNILENGESGKWSGARPHVSVILLGYRDAALLERAVRTFAASAVSSVSWEMVLVLNGAAPEVGELARRLVRENAFPLQVIPLEGARPGAARNFGVKAARAPLLLFLDDDTESFQDLPAAVERIFRSPEVLAAGGANLTPPGSGALERATGAALASWFGAGAMRKRYLLAPEGPATEHSLILCNLAVKKSVFEQEKGFALHLVSNEENVLLQRLESAGAVLWRSPELAVYHRRRSRWAELGSQAAKYGAGRAQNILLLPSSFRWMYLLPSALLVYLLLLPLLLFAGGALWLLPLGVYGGLALGLSLYSALRERDAALLLQLGVFPWVHLAYGWGFFKAIGAWTGKRKRLLDHAL